MPDETKGQQDTTSAETKGTSAEAPTFTEKQVEEASRKAASDALAKAGRADKALKTREDAVKSAETDLAEARRIRREAALESARDEPDKLTIIRAEGKLEETLAKLATAERELNESKEKVSQLGESEAQSTKERNAREIATRSGVDPVSLIKFTDGSTEAMEELAKQLPPVGEKGASLLVDSGKTIGEGITISEKDIESPGFAVRYHNDPEFKTAVEKAYREGRIK